MKKLIFCGTGIKFLSHLTKETISVISNAEKVLYLVNEPLSEQWIKDNSKSYESLSDIYYAYSSRKACYEAIAGKIIEEQHKVEVLCVVFYGHPCVFAQSPLYVDSKLRNRPDISIEILPAISSEACLYADLRVDPGSAGMQSMETTSFLLYGSSINPHCHTILWQAGMLGRLGHKPPDTQDNLILLYDKLRSRLQSYYGLKHNCIVYEASLYPGVSPQIKNITIQELKHDIGWSDISTLYIPPKALENHKQKVDQEIAKLLY